MSAKKHFLQQKLMMNRLENVY